jgi:hypothetical protein
MEEFKPTDSQSISTKAKIIIDIMTEILVALVIVLIDLGVKYNQPLNNNEIITPRTPTIVVIPQVGNIRNPQSDSRIDLHHQG